MNISKSGSFLRALFSCAALVLLATTLHAQVTHFIVTRSGGVAKVGTLPITAGVPTSLAISAVDDNGKRVLNYNQRVTLQLVEPRLDKSSWVTVRAVLNRGFADNVIVTPVHAGNFDRRITVTDGNIATYDAARRLQDSDGLFTIQPAGFSVTSDGSTVPLSITNYLNGFPANVRVTALNSDGSVDETYQGTVTLSSNSATPTFSPTTVSFLGDSNGVEDEVVLSFIAEGSGDTIKATDGSITTNIASSSFTVYTQNTSGATVATNVGRLVIGAVTGVNTGYPGQTVTVAFTATNPQSGAPAANNVPAIPPFDVTGPIDFIITLKDAGGAVVSTAVFRYAGDILGAITKDTTAKFQATIVVPAYVTPGAFTATVSAVQAESGPVTVSGTPDLAITRFDYAPGQYRGGEAMRFDMAWTNLLSSFVDGTNNAKVPNLSIYRVEIHLSSNSTFGDADDVLVWQGSFLGNDFGLDLLGGQSVVINDSFLLPKNIPGTFYLLAKINSAGGRPNNFSTGFTEVIGPTPGNVLYPGNNVVLANEDAKITLLPDTSPDTTRISLTTAGGQSAGLSDEPAISQDGRYAVFQSLGALSTDGAGGTTYNIYLRDALLNSTTLLSPAANGGAANGDNIHAHINSDAHYVVYQSSASNLVNGDTNGYVDIFVRDTIKGTTIRISSSPALQSNQDSSLPDISGDGRFIVFESKATNLVAGANPFGLQQIYLYDRCVSGQGPFDVLGNTGFTLVSKNAVTGKSGTANSGTPRISRDGHYVVFSTTAPNLISGSTSFSQILRWNRGTGALSTVSTNTAGKLADGDTGYPVINANGHYVVFASRAHNLTNDTYTQGIPHLFRVFISNIDDGVKKVVRINGFVGASATATLDTATGSIFAINVDGAGSGYSSAPPVVIQGGGGTGATATATIDQFTGRVKAITVTNGGTGYTSIPTITVGTAFAGVVEPGDAPFMQYLDLGSFEPAISDDGNTVAYVSESVNLLPPIPVHHIDRTTYQSTSVQNYEDRDDASDIYVTDLSNPIRPVTNRASVSRFGYEQTTWDVSGLFTSQIVQSRFPAISGDGGYVAFSSDGKNHNGLVFGFTNFDYLATNGVKDVYIFNAKKSSPVSVTDIPAVKLDVPASLNITANLDLPLAASITANPRPITQVEFYADGLLVDTATQPTVAGSGQYSGTFKVSTLNVSQTRTFTVVAVAVDSLGARSLESNASLVTVSPVSGKLPFVTLTNPSAPTTVSNVSTLLVQANSSDADGTITSVGFYVDGILVATGAEDGIFNYQGKFSTSQFVPGTHVLTAQVIDNVGNTVISSPVTLTISAATAGAPTAVLGAVPATLAAGLNIPVKGTGTPASGQKIRTIDAYSNGVVIATISNAPGGIFTGSPQTDYLAATAGPLDLSFTFTPDTPNTTYSLYIVVTDFAGNTVVSAKKSIVVGAAASTVAKDTVDQAYQSLLLRSATLAELNSAIKQYGTNLTLAQMETLVVKSSEFRDNGSEIILSYLAVWGKYPTYDEYSALLAFRLLGGSDADLIDGLFATPEYKALYGDVNDLSVVFYGQYALVKTFALRTYGNLYDTGTGTVTANVTAQEIFNSISTPETPGQAVVDFINVHLSGGKDGVLLTKMQIAGLIMTLTNRAPTTAEVDGLITVPLASIANYYSTGTSLKPVFILQPQSRVRPAGSGFSLTVDIGYPGDPALSIQWYKNGVKIPGATGNRYAIKNVTAGDAGNYTAKAKNAVGTSTSAVAKLTVK